MQQLTDTRLSRQQLEISCFPVEHTPVVPAFGYVIKYGGARIVISGDTAVVKSLEEQSKNADVAHKANPSAIHFHRKKRQAKRQHKC